MLKFVFGAFIIIILYAVYFVLLTFGMFKRKDKGKMENKMNKFGILVAARNEEEVIGNLIESLKEQNYPKDLFEIFVIINNCTDNTEKISRDKGASIIKCNIKISSKGEALKYTYNKLADRNDIDAYVIFDADNIVHEDFLKSMNDIINEGYNVAQGFRDTKNISDNWLTSSYAILYYMQSLFLNKPRYRLGKSSFINGTGFMVKKEVIDKYGFEPKTMTEDIEFTAMCALNNEKIAFAEEAITYDEQVLKFRDSVKQRKRWSFGTKQCLKYYAGPLIKAGAKDKNFECFDVVLFYMSVIFQLICTFIPFFLILFIVFNIRNFVDSIGIYLGIILVIYLCGVFFRIFLIKHYNKSIKDNLGGILFFDLFLISWMPISAISIFKKDCNWDPIKHDRNVDIENT